MKCPGLVSLILGSALLGGTAAQGATPSSGSLTPGNPTVTWTGNPVGANANESTCVDGVTCDVYTLTLAPGDYTGKRIAINTSWLVPANDYDLYVHAGTLSGPIVTQDGNGAPNTAENGSIPIDPPVVTTARVYVVHMVAFSVAPGDPYTGVASLAPESAPRFPTYLPGSLTFSENVALKIPVAAQDGEPSVRVDVRGNCYVGGIRGVPAGVDLWRFDLNPQSPTFDPGMQNPAYLGQPDAFLPQDPNDPTTGGADGGGDIDISVSFPSHPDSIPVVTIVSLAAANISSAVSYDRGETFTLSPAVAIVPADDRQWIESTGSSRVYMMYRAPIPATGLFVTRSDDNGLTYPLTTVVNPSGTTPGYIDVNHANGSVFVAHQSSSTGTVARSNDGGVTWKNTTVDNTSGHDQLFDVVKVGDDGTVYSLWGDGRNIFMAHSTDNGDNWSSKVRVNDNSVYRTNLFPWMEAGSAGRVVVVWYGTTNNVNDDSADWSVLLAQTTDATAQNPTFRQQVISDHIIHGSNISTGGLTGGANRNLIDYFQVAIDPQGAAVVAFTDDHNDYAGHTYVTRQLDGTSLYAAANGTGLVNPVYPPPLPTPDPNDPEVADFLHDAVTGLLQPIVTDNPFDILWVDYSCEDMPPDPIYITATMKVSALDTIPAGANWRASFSANAPGGVSDRGSQFFIQVNADNPAVPTFRWGTAVRGGNGSVVYTERGDAAGYFDTVNDCIVMKVALDDINPFVTVGPPIGVGSVLHGLRGQTFTTGANGIRDICRGGTSFTFPFCGPRSGTAAPTPPVEPVSARFLGAARPNPTHGASTIEFHMPRPGFAELSVFDVNGRRVRSIQAGNLPAGDHTRTWDGRTDRFSDAPAGIYFFMLNTVDGIRSQRVVLAR